MKAVSTATVDLKSSGRTLRSRIQSRFSESAPGALKPIACLVSTKCFIPPQEAPGWTGAKQPDRHWRIRREACKDSYQPRERLFETAPTTKDARRTTGKKGDGEEGRRDLCSWGIKRYHETTPCCETVEFYTFTSFNRN